MAQFTSPRIGCVAAGYTVKWNGTVPFNGYWLVQLIAPTAGGNVWNTVDYSPLVPGVPLPMWTVMPIIQGTFTPLIGLFFNLDLTPPGSQYRAWLYDSTNRQISGPGSNFTVTTTTFTPVITTPVIPTSVNPSPVGPDV